MNEEQPQGWPRWKRILSALTFGVVLPQVALRKRFALMAQADEVGVVMWGENQELTALLRPSVPSEGAAPPRRRRSCQRRVRAPERV